MVQELLLKYINERLHIVLINWIDAYILPPQVAASS